MLSDIYWCRGWILGLRHHGSRSTAGHTYAGTNGYTYAGAIERYCYPDTGPNGSYGYAYHPTDTDPDADTGTAGYVDTRANCDAYTGTPNGDSGGSSSHADCCANSATGLGAV